jgi:hypothetical protein
MPTSSGNKDYIQNRLNFWYLCFFLIQGCVHMPSLVPLRQCPMGSNRSTGTRSATSPRKTDHQAPPPSSGSWVPHLAPKQAILTEFSSVPPAKFRNNILNRASNASFHIQCDSLLRNDSDVRRYRPRARATEALVNKPRMEEREKDEGAATATGRYRGLGGQRKPFNDSYPSLTVTIRKTRWTQQA